MTDQPDRYQEHLDAFGASLRTSALAHQALRPVVTRRPLVAAAGLALAALIAGVVLGASPGSRSVDVLGQAQAALATGGELVHYAVRESDGPSTGTGIELRVARDRCPKTGPVEVWQATNPVRWRVVRPALVRSPGCRGARGSAADGLLGEQHYAFADGTLTRYSPEEDRLTITHGYGSGRGSTAELTGGMFPGKTRAVEPLMMLRRMLADGMLVEKGERTVGGRPVRTLSQTTEQRRLINGKASTWDQVTVYDVDAETFAPVRIVRSGGIPIIRGKGASLRMVGVRPTATQFDFERYERMPLDDVTRRLLTIVPSRPPTVTETGRAPGQNAPERRRP